MSPLPLSLESQSSDAVNLTCTGPSQRAFSRRPRSHGPAGGKGRRSRSLRFEPLESRELLSIGLDSATPLATFSGTADSQTAVFRYTFSGTPQLTEYARGCSLSMSGEESWLAEGDPLVPVRPSTILLPRDAG